MSNGYGDTPITVTTAETGEYNEYEARLRIGNRTFILSEDNAENPLTESRAEKIRNNVIEILSSSSFDVKSRQSVSN